MEEAETMMSSNRRETWLHRGFKVDFASKSRGKRRVLKVTSRKNKPSWSRVMHSHKIQSNRWWSKHVKQVAQRNESTKMFQRVWWSRSAPLQTQVNLSSQSEQRAGWWGWWKHRYVWVFIPMSAANVYPASHLHRPHPSALCSADAAACLTVQLKMEPYTAAATWNLFLPVLLSHILTKICKFYLHV